jgi:DNA-binding GntR family transcriptional regulator
VASLGFKEIAATVRQEIEGGKLSPGELMPSEAALCARWGVSRTTVRRALQVLETDHLISVIPGRGRVVRDASGSEPMRGESRAAYIARVLREEFRRGDLPDGAVTTSPAVADRFDVSEPTARDALKILAADGLVAMAPGRGWNWRSANVPYSKTEEVAARLRGAISGGEWQVGARLPGELTLAAEYGVGRVTVRRAIGRLVEDGILATKAGVGTVVLRRP